MCDDFFVLGPRAIAIAACQLRAVVAFAINLPMADDETTAAAAAGCASGAWEALLAHERACADAQCARRMHAAYWRWMTAVYEVSKKHGLFVHKLADSITSSHMKYASFSSLVTRWRRFAISRPDEVRRDSEPSLSFISIWQSELVLFSFFSSIGVSKRIDELVNVLMMP